MKRKHRYKCELVGLQDYGSNRYIALVRRHDTHARLGVPTGRITQTSLVVRIDFERK